MAHILETFRDNLNPTHSIPINTLPVTSIILNFFFFLFSNIVAMRSSNEKLLLHKSPQIIADVSLVWRSNIWRATACTAAWWVIYTPTKRSMTILYMLQLLSDSLVSNHYFTLKFLFTNAMVDVNFGLFWDYPCLRVAAIDIEIKVPNFVFITSFNKTKLARLQEERNDKLIHDNLLISTIEFGCLI